MKCQPLKNIELWILNHLSGILFVGIHFYNVL